ncbi:hypothetical protein [Rheinheimera sp. F8]|uniref:hypothetical protein n=1 Tax=Rheinheimera sp. F8 TaxID=1763998 RepID=UPI000744C22A|nr:hypothetical protein [Rheinheimera sp. F8]ALZ74417.1 hypothetical protein ATY27_00635 [Rheinheimera sp. F8]
MFKRSLILIGAAVILLGWWLWHQPSQTTQTPYQTPFQQQSSGASTIDKDITAAADAKPPKQPAACQQVLPDEDWIDRPERTAIRQYLFNRLQQGDSPEQLLLMLRDRSSPDKALSQRQAELQFELLDALSRYEGSLIKYVFRQKAYSDFFEGLRRFAPAEKIDYLRTAPEIELVYLEPSGRLDDFQPKTTLLLLALRQRQFDEALTGLRFLPRDYSMLLGELLNTQQLEQLLQQTDDLQSRHNLLNLADLAVYHFRDDLLPLLARYQVLPSRQDGLFSAMDLAFSSTWRKKGWDEAERRQRQQATIQFLQTLGYPLHGKLNTMKNGKVFLQVSAVVEPRFISYDEDLINLAQAQQLLPLQSLTAPEPLRALLMQYQQLGLEQQRIKAACLAEQNTELTAQGLWSEHELLFQLDKLTQQHSTGELPQLLHQQDPALLAFYWQQQDTGLATSYGDVPSTEAEFVKAIENNPDPKQAADLLLVLSMQPQWAKHWPNGLAVSTLENLLTYEGTKHWQVMQQNGFDLGITDTRGRNLYPLAFADSTEAVSLLINAKVPLQQNPLGPDALDLALDASYLQQKLHPALFYILQETERLRPSHLSRLKRLQQYRPALFQQLQTQFKLPDLTAMTPNPMLSLEP